MAKRGSDGAYFLDRNPEMFSIVLEFYRNGKVIVPEKTPLELLHDELLYFGIEHEGKFKQIKIILSNLHLFCRDYNSHRGKYHLNIILLITL